MPEVTTLATVLVALCAGPDGVRCVRTFTCGDLLLERRVLLFFSSKKRIIGKTHETVVIEPKQIAIGPK